VPHHSASSRHPARWAVGVAVLAVAALVLILRPAVGHGGDRAAPAAVTTAPSQTTLPTTRATTAAPTPRPTTPKPTPKPTPVTIPAAGTGQLVTVPGTAGPTGPGTRMN
jgi:cell division septation protein DedD